MLSSLINYYNNMGLCINIKIYNNGVYYINITTVSLVPSFLDWNIVKKSFINAVHNDRKDLDFVRSEYSPSRTCDDWSSLELFFRKDRL